MADIISVALNRDCLPSTERWSREVERICPDLIVDTTIDLRSHQGWVQFRLGRKMVGFEYMLTAMSQDEFSSAVNARIEGYECLAGLTLRGGHAGLISAVAAAAALARLTGGIVVEVDGDSLVDSAEAEAWAIGEIAALKRWIERERAKKRVEDKLKKNPELCQVEVSRLIGLLKGAQAKEVRIGYGSMYLPFLSGEVEIELKVEGFELLKHGSVLFDERALKLAHRSVPIDGGWTKHYIEVNDDLRLLEEITRESTVIDAQLRQSNALSISFSAGYELKVKTVDLHHWDISWTNGATITVHRSKMKVY